MKVRRPGVGSICFVAKLNRSSTALPQAVLNSKASVSMTTYNYVVYNVGGLESYASNL